MFVLFFSLIADNISFNFLFILFEVEGESGESRGIFQHEVLARIFMAQKE